MENLNNYNCWCFHLKRRWLHPSTGTWQLWHGNRAGHWVTPICESPVGLLGNINRKKVGSHCSKRAQRHKTHSMWRMPTLPGVVMGDEYILSKSWQWKQLICSLLNSTVNYANIKLFISNNTIWVENKMNASFSAQFVLSDYSDRIYLQTVRTLYHYYHPISIDIKVSVLYKGPFLC